MIIANNNQRISSKPAFGNAGLNVAMNYLATNQAIGASATDLGFMVIPRTAIDSTRTPEAGLETGRREMASCLLYAGMGFFGLGAARLIGAVSDTKEYEVPLHKINAGSSAIDTLAHSWNAALTEHGREFTNKEKIIDTFLNNVFGSVSGLDVDKKTLLSSDSGIQKEIVTDLKTLLVDAKNSKEYTIPKDTKTKLIQKIINATGASEHLILPNQAKPITENGIKKFEEIKISAGDLLDNTYSLGRTFMQDKVSAEFKKTDKLTDNQFIQSLKKFNSKKMFIGLGAASAVALSMQAINRWMTKQKTGSDGFQVYKGPDGTGQKAQKDNSTLFKALKVAAAAGMGAYTMKMIGGKLKDLPKKIEFTKLMPNMNQYKFIYGVTIVGRLLASSDKNELRETATRDVLGFTSWLVLGDVVAKTVAKAFEDKHPDIKLLNCEDKKATGFNKLMKSSVKTHEELLYSEKGSVGKSIKEASRAATSKATKAIKFLNIAQLSGYAFSGLVLGVFIPMLNKAITNKLHERGLEKAKAQENSQKIAA